MIYYVEDETNIRELVVYTLTQMGMPAQGFAEAQSFYEAVEAELPELVLLDIMLPGEDGMTILRRLREDRRTAELPIVMVTAKDAEADTVRGPDLGADDYISKPFGMAELAARVRARLRRSAPKKNPGVYAAGGLKLDDAAHSVTADGAEVALTLKEYELLRFLMENRGIAFSREQLLDNIWGYDYYGGTRTVDVHIQTLRAKLGACGMQIETVRGVGYRFGGNKG